MKLFSHLLPLQQHPLQSQLLLVTRILAVLQIHQLFRQRLQQRHLINRLTVTPAQAVDSIILAPFKAVHLDIPVA